MNENLVLFLYLLMRDELPTGKVERIMQQIRTLVLPNTVIYSSHQLERYARDLASEMLESSESEEMPKNLTPLEYCEKMVEELLRHENRFCMCSIHNQRPRSPLVKGLGK